VLVTPFVVTWTGWPTISEAGVHPAWAKAAPGKAATLAKAPATRRTKLTFMAPLSF
jgi:hypothetical protein